MKMLRFTAMSLCSGKAHVKHFKSFVKLCNSDLNTKSGTDRKNHDIK